MDNGIITLISLISYEYTYKLTRPKMDTLYQFFRDSLNFFYIEIFIIVYQQQVYYILNNTNINYTINRMNETPVE